MTGSIWRATVNAAGISTRVAEQPVTDNDNARPVPRWRQQLVDLLQLEGIDGAGGRELRRDVYERGALTPGYMLMCVLSAGIATLGLLQSSVAVVIGAMLVSPLMSPIAALGFGLASFDTQRLRDSALVVTVGALIGIVTALLVTWISPIDDITPEILARTQPTLLDLAVALLSGAAGGYAIVRKQGETAIGVAIATALMPPIAVVGYGVAVMNADIAGGAMLLFLTNLAAIAIIIAGVARLTGAANPRAGQRVGRGVYVIAALLILGLLTPLALTLLRLRQEIEARHVTQRVISQTFNVTNKDISKLDVSWSLRGKPKIVAIVITPRFLPEAQAQALAKISAALDVTPEFSLQQIEIGSGVARTEAMLEAALARTAAGITNDIPPIAEIRAALDLPIVALWHDATTHIVNVQLAAAPGWTLADYRSLEPAEGRQFGTWTLRIVPPTRDQLPISIDPAQFDLDVEAAIWALKAWGLRSVVIRLPDGEDYPARTEQPPAATLALRLSSVGIMTNFAKGSAEQSGIDIVALPLPPRLASPPVLQLGTMTEPKLPPG